MTLKSMAFAALFAATAMPAAAQIKAADPEGMLAFLKSEGIVATLGKDDYGDPNIKIKYYGTNFSIYFYGCSNGADCSSIQFYVGYRTDGSWTQEQANVWNRDWRYTKAYVSKNGSARMEFDVYTGNNGISDANFSEIFSLWTRNISKFEEAIDW